MATSMAEAVALTAATMAILSAICFGFFYHYIIVAEKRRIRDSSRGIGREDTMITDTRGTLKGAVIQNNGVQLLYFRNPIEEKDQKRADSRFNDPRISKQSEEVSKCNHRVHRKMNPLPWEKVDIDDADHPVVWNEIAKGSLRFDDELIETLFAYNATKLDSSNSTESAKLSILHPNKSHITGIALKAIAISPKQILDAVSEGRGLNRDVLGKLSKILPDEEEVSKILKFTGNPTKLPEAEAFFYHILKAMPTALTRINTMFFRSNFNQEVLEFKESLQTIELGCQELRTPGIFWKLLEGILKVGNRINAGTPKGNAKGFNLHLFWELHDIRSSRRMDLLEFVVEQVAVAEGKRCAINTNSRSNGSDTKIENNDEKYLMLGLQVLKRLSADLSNVKKAHIIYYNGLIRVLPNLSDQVSTIREMVRQSNEGDGFVKEMKEFVEECEEEIRVMRKEETRVWEILSKTRDFYKVKDPISRYSISRNPLDMFHQVMKFLENVDGVCVDLAKKVERKRRDKTSVAHLNKSLFYLI